MIAVFTIAGKQYKAAQGEIVRVNSRLLDGEVGKTMNAESVNMIVDGKNIMVGKPDLDNAKVTLKVRSAGRGNKVIAFKYKRRKGYRRTVGHRQDFTDFEVAEVSAGGKA